MAVGVSVSSTDTSKSNGLLPICAACKKVRDDRGYWNQIEVYLRERSEADFTHTICPDCLKKHYPTYAAGK